jgi:hypothetical protein
MKLLGLVKNPAIISRTLATLAEAPEVPQRSPGRGPPFWKSRVLCGGVCAWLEVGKTEPRSRARAGEGAGCRSTTFGAACDRSRSCAIVCAVILERR